MPPSRILVFLPCHALDDFPTWLEEPEAHALLEAWTAAWDPWLVATVGASPWWASVDLPAPTDGGCLGIVPAPWDDRFAMHAGAGATADSVWVRNVAGGDAIRAAAARAVGHDGPADDLPGRPLADEFRDYGLARLLCELLARRMRSSLDDEAAALDAGLVAAARLAVAGDAAGARAGLRECHATLEGARARFYPVDVWLLDLVLLAGTTLGRGLDRELDSPVPAGLVATGHVVESLAAANPAAVARIRDRLAAGTLSLVGGRHDSRPLDWMPPEQILDSFDRGLAAWRHHVGAAPDVYGQCAGGSSAILPQVLERLGFKGAIWSLFDGTPLPDPGTGRIRWEGTGGGCIDGIGRPPLDARLAKTILELPGRIGDAMDHDHTVVVPFAHYAGTAGPWFEALRRIGGTATALGTFVTPEQFFTRTAGAGTTVSFEPDTFPTTMPAAAADEDQVAVRLEAAADEARGLLGAREPLLEALPQRAAPDADTAAKGTGGRAARPRGFAGWFGGGRPDELVLENDLLRVAVHPQTGGLLSVRRPADRANRLSQRLSLRTTRPPPPVGSAWEDPLDRAVYGDMRAEAIERVELAGGRRGIESRGRLGGPAGADAGRFTQRVELVPGLPLVLVTLDVRPSAPPRGPLLENHVACRFAWNENDDVDMARDLHTQAVATDRGRFTAPWFVGLADGRDAGIDGPGGIVLLTGGLPWHVRSSPHMLDTILPAGRCDPPPRIGIGIGLARPWDVALAVCGGLRAEDIRTAAHLPGVPANVRLTVGEVRFAAGRLAAARLGLLESAGRSGQVELEWAAEVAAARVTDFRPPAAAAEAAADPRVTVTGRTTTVYLRRHEWLPLDVEFRT